VLLEPRGTRKCDSSSSGGLKGGDVHDVRDLCSMSMSLLLLLLTLSTATALAFGMVLRLLLGPTRLLIREVLVAALLLYSREFVSVLLLALATRAHVL
jgi:hypothetical protein